MKAKNGVVIEKVNLTFIEYLFCMNVNDIFESTYVHISVKDLSNRFGILTFVYDLCLNIFRTRLESNYCLFGN